MTINKLSEYGHSFQIKVLASLLTDNKFLQGIIDILTPDFFESEAHKWIVQYILEYSSKYHIYPTIEVLHVEIKKQRKESLRVSIIENLREVYSCNEDDIEYVQEEFFNFCKNQALKGALLQSVELLNDANYDDIRTLINGALKHDRERDKGHDYTVDTEERFRDDDAKTIKFPWKVLNDRTDGGLGPGHLMLIFAPPGVGKTTLAANIVADALKQGKNVLFYALEISAVKMGQKIDSIITGIDIKDLKKNRKRVEEIISKLPGRLIIKSYPPKKASLDTLRAHKNNLKVNEGFVADIEFIDYPELLKSLKIRKEIREETDDIFTEIKGDAMEEGIPYVCPSQINRLGARDKIIEGDKVAGTYGKMMIGDFNISLSRDRKDKLNNTGRIHIIKSRLGPDGMTYNAIIDLSRGYIDISEEEYIEDGEEGSQSANGYSFNEEDVKELKDRFQLFMRKQNLPEDESPI